MATIPGNAITAFAHFNSELYAGSYLRGKIWKVTTAGITEVFTFPDVATVGIGGAGGVSGYSARIWDLAEDDGRLHVPVVDTNGLGLYSFDGVGWSNVASGGSGQEPRHIAAFKGDLYLTMKSSTQARTYRADRAYPTSAVFTSASFDAALAATDKVFLKCELFHRPLNANESVAVQYELDDSGVWTGLGTSDVDGATRFSASFATGIKAKRIKLMLTFSLVTTSACPIVSGILVTYLAAPDAKAEWVFDALLEGTAQAPLVRLDNSSETSTGAQLADAIWATRAKKQALSFTDLDAEAKTVLLTDLEEKVGAGSQRLGQGTRAKVVLVEA